MQLLHKVQNRFNSQVKNKGITSRMKREKHNPTLSNRKKSQVKESQVNKYGLMVS
jgi:hypothetical protein